MKQTLLILMAVVMVGCANYHIGHVTRTGVLFDLLDGNGEGGEILGKSVE